MKHIFKHFCFIFWIVLLIFVTPALGNTDTDWLKQFNGTTLNEFNIAIDNHDNVVLAGTISGTANLGGGDLTSNGSIDMFLAKFNASGDHIWSKSFGAVGDSRPNEVISRVIVDAQDNILITGYFLGISNFGGGDHYGGVLASDIFIAKYDPNGNYLWSKSFGGKSIGQEGPVDKGMDISCDLTGNVILTGFFSGPINFGGGDIESDIHNVYQIFLAKFDKDGNHLWSKGLGDSGRDRGIAVKIDSTGKIILTGMFTGAVNFDGHYLETSSQSLAYTDVFLAKFDSAGNHLWSKSFGDIGGDSLSSMAVDQENNILITGSISSMVNLDGTAIGPGLYVVKFNSEGTYLWARDFKTSVAKFNSIVTDSNGNIWMTGSHEASINFGGTDLIAENGQDLFFAKLKADGSHIWSRSFGRDHYLDFGSNVTVDAAGNMIATGLISGAVDFGGENLISSNAQNNFLLKLSGNQIHQRLLLATTTSTDAIGILDYLKPCFEKETGIELQWTSTAVGDVFESGQICAVDALLVHSPEDEKIFIGNGYGKERTEVMYDDFVIIGPASDPAGIKGKTSLRALKAIKSKPEMFISRGDNSFIHEKEMSLWIKAGIENPGNETWYLQAQSDMLTTIYAAQKKNGYTITDRATYYTYLSKEGIQAPMKILVEGDTELINVYILLTLDQTNCPDARHDLSVQFSEWMVSDGAQQKIEAFKSLAGYRVLKPVTDPIDADNDGIAISHDQCPNTPEGVSVDTKGCTITRGDFDGDGKVDLKDSKRCLDILTSAPASVKMSSDVYDDDRIDIKDTVFTIQQFYMQRDTINIGFGGVFSAEAGSPASHGISALRGAQMAVDDFNAKGGILGKKIKLLSRGDDCHPQVAVSTATNLVADGSHVIIGHICSDATLAANEIYKNAQLIVISPTSTSDDLTLKGEHSNFFRTIAHDSVQMSQMASFIVNRLNVGKAALLYDKSNSGAAQMMLVKQYLDAFGGIEIVLFEGVTPGAVDYSTVVSKIKRSEVDVVLWGGDHTTFSKIVRQAKYTGIEPIFFGTTSIMNDIFVTLAGEYSEGVYATGTTDTSTIPLYESISDRYQDTYGDEPGPFFGHGYACVQAFATAVEKATSLEYDKLRAAMFDITVDSPLGLIGFDEKGDIVGTETGFSVYQVQEGIFTQAD